MSAATTRQDALSISAPELFNLYRRSGFLYPAKRAALTSYRSEVERTWSSLLAAQPDLLRIAARRASDGTLDKAVSAFPYTSTTWQAQHLVSAVRHQPEGTLGVILELLEWLQSSGAGHIRLVFRPDNPGVMPLFVPAARRLPAARVACTLLDYGIAEIHSVRLPRSPVAVRRLNDDEHSLADRFYARVLHRVELASLCLDDLRLRDLDAVYRKHGLRRHRTVLAAFDRGRVAGACIVNRAPVGTNLSLLENAVEYLRVAPGYVGSVRRDIWHALARAALDDLRPTRGWVVVLTHPGDHAIAAAAGLVAPQPKRYWVITVNRGDGGFLHAIEAMADQYRTREARP